MKFESIHVARYGCLAGLSTPDPLPSVVVVLGPNESGKSTFFSLLTDLVYGFRPATRDSHPYAPWSGGDPEAQARLRLDDGTAVEIYRRLASSGRGSVSVNGRREDLRNRALGAADHVSRGMFRNVYALTLAELASLEGESWNIVQDRLVAALGMKGLTPPREVAEAFETAAKKLWRPDNLGKPRVRMLREELTELYKARREAVELDRALRGKEAERVAAGEKLNALAEERSRERGRREVLEDRLARLLPVRRVLVRIAELQAEAGPPDELAGLPPDPVARLAELRDKSAQAVMRVEECEREAAACAETVAAYEGSRDEAVAEAEGRVRRAIDLADTMADLQREVAVAEDRVAEMAARCDEQCAALFDAPLDDVPPGALGAVGVQELEERVGAHERARAKREAERDGDGGGSLMRLAGARKPGRGRLVVGLAGVVAGLALGAWRLLYPDMTVVLAGVAVGAGVAGSAAVLLGAAGLVVLVVRQGAVRRYDRYRRAVAEAEKRRAKRLAELAREEEGAAEAVARVVAGLPVRRSLLAAPGLELATGIGRMIELLDRLGERRRVLEERRRGVAEAEAEIGGVREWVEGWGGGGGGGVGAVVGAGEEGGGGAGGLRGLLEAALKARETAGVARRQMERIAGERAEAEAGRAAAALEVEAFEGVLGAFAEGDPDGGAGVAGGRLAARRRAQGQRAELEAEHANLADIEAEVAAAEAGGEGWGDLRDRLNAIAAAEDRVAGETAELQGVVGRLDTEVRRLREGETVAVVEGRIEAVKEQVREAKRGRDRAFVIARLVRQADRSFRDANQPELLLRAGRYLGKVTRGRYDRIEMGDVGDESFYLREPSGDRRIRVGETTSQGTKEQVYMALRLAIVNHLDGDQERLPIFMDETLVNWDAWRRDQAFDLLEQLAAERQVFIFTCHPAMAAEMEDRGGKVIPLAQD